MRVYVGRIMCGLAVVLKVFLDTRVKATIAAFDSVPSFVPDALLTEWQNGVILKVLRMCELVLVVLFLTVGVCHDVIGEETEATTHFSRGVDYLNKSMWDEAIAEFSMVIAINPRYVEAYYNRGLAYAQGKGRYDQAISDYNKAIEINPSFAEAYNNRGIAYAQGKGQYDQAISNYNKAIEINPSFAEAYNNRGLAYAQGKGRYDQAISNYNKAIEINPSFAEAYNNRGITYKNQAQYDQAISDYTKAIDINPRYVEAYYNRGNAYAQGKGQYDQAISDYNKAIEINPRYSKAYNNRGVAYYYKGKYNKAWEDIHKAQDLGVQVKPKFLDKLRKASGRER